MDKIFAWTDPKKAAADELRYWRERSIEERVSAVEQLRWMVASVHEASRHFRRVWAHDHLPKLVAAMRPEERVARRTHAA